MIVLLLALLAGVADARPRKRPPPPPAPEPVQAPPPPAQPDLDTLWEGPLPLNLGPLPQGLASLSAQGCNACHYEAHDDWVDSPHAQAWARPDFVSAVTASGSPACLVCHLPLAVQAPDRVALRDGQLTRFEAGPNPSWDPTLQSEGVTCAVCHIREGAVIASHPVSTAPHITKWSPQLGRSELCAPCHQLTWPGASQPFYDTYGEWQRSAQAAAGVQCQDCHMGRGGDTPLQHSSVTHGRGLSVLVQLSGARLVRGGDPISGTVILQNTGAGHAYPTGSPYKGVRISAVLVGPPDDSGQPALAASRSLDLTRTLEDAPPYRITADERLPAGAQRSWPIEFALPLNAPAGDWSLEIRSTTIVRGKPRGQPLLVRRVPLQVE